MYWTVKAGFTLVGDDFDPAVITERLGVEPTRAWRKGDPKTKSRPPYSFSRWLWEGPVAVNGDVSEQVASVLNRFEPLLENLDGLRPELEIAKTEIPVIVYMYGDKGMRGTGISPGGAALGHSLLERVVALGAGIDIDEYASVDQRPLEQRGPGERPLPDGTGWE
jgi:hypothetical protein